MTSDAGVKQVEVGDLLFYRSIPNTYGGVEEVREEGYLVDSGAIVSDRAVIEVFKGDGDDAPKLRGDDDDE